MVEDGQINQSSEMDPGAAELTSCYANRFHVYVSGGMTRLTFGEYYPNTGDNYHSAISISTDGAELAANLILKTIKLNKAKTQKLEEAQQDGLKITDSVKLEAKDV